MLPCLYPPPPRCGPDGSPRQHPPKYHWACADLCRDGPACPALPGVAPIRKFWVKEKLYNLSKVAQLNLFKGLSDITLISKPMYWTSLSYCSLVLSWPKGLPRIQRRIPVARSIYQFYNWRSRINTDKEILPLQLENRVQIVRVLGKD